jgi:hypothetical protein
LFIQSKATYPTMTLLFAVAAARRSKLVGAAREPSNKNSAAQAAPARIEENFIVCFLKGLISRDNGLSLCQN